MKVIFANINGTVNDFGGEYQPLLNACIKNGLGKPIHVYSFEMLKENLKKETPYQYLLFSNFPPDISYDPDTKPPYTADSYAITVGHFQKLCNEHVFKAIHIITGAPENMVSENMIESLSTNFPVTLKRHEDWMDGSNFYFLKRCYMVNKINQASY